MTALLTLNNVSKSFTRGGILSRHRIEAVKNVSFTLENNRPEIFAIIGESGSGKTTLARMILGMQEVSGGSLTLEGHRVGGRTRKERLALSLIHI